MTLPPPSASGSPSPHPLRKLIQNPRFWKPVREQSHAQEARGEEKITHQDALLENPGPSFNALIVHRNSQTLTHRRKLEQRLPRGLMPAGDSDMFAMVERGARRRQVALAGERAPKSYDLGAWSAFVETTLSPRGDRCLLGHRDRPLALLAWSEGRISFVPVPGIQKLSVSPPPLAVYTPDGQQLLAVAGSDARGQTHLWRSKKSSLGPDRETLGAGRVLALSTLGNRVATENFDPSYGHKLRVWLFGEGLAPSRWFERRIARPIDRAQFTNNGQSLIFSDVYESHLIAIEPSLPMRLKFDGIFFGLREDGEDLVSVFGPAADDEKFRLTHIYEGRIDSEKEVEVGRGVRFDPPVSSSAALHAHPARRMMMTAREPSAAQLIVLDTERWRLLNILHLETITERAYDDSLAISRPDQNLIGAVGTWDTLLLSSATGVAISCIRSGETKPLLCPPLIGDPQAIAWQFEGESVALFAQGKRPMMHLWNFDDHEGDSARRWPSLTKRARSRMTPEAASLSTLKGKFLPQKASQAPRIWGA